MSKTTMVVSELVMAWSEVINKRNLEAMVLLKEISFSTQNPAEAVEQLSEKFGERVVEFHPGLFGGQALHMETMTTILAQTVSSILGMNRIIRFQPVDYEYLKISIDKEMAALSFRLHLLRNLTN